MASLLSCKFSLACPSTFLGAGLGQSPFSSPAVRDCGLCIQARGSQEVVTTAPLGSAAKALPKSRGRAKRGDQLTVRVVTAGAPPAVVDSDLLELKRSLLESQWALPFLEEEEGMGFELEKDLFFDVEREQSVASTSGREVSEASKPAAKKRGTRQRKVQAKPGQPKIRPRTSNVPGVARRRRLQSQKERCAAHGDPVPVFKSRSQLSEAVRSAAATYHRESGSRFEESLSLFEECLNTHQLLTPEEEKYLCKKVHIGQELQGAKERLERALEREATLEEWAAHVEIEDMGQLVKHVRQAQGAKEKLVVSNLRLVISVAKNYCTYGLPLVDLVQEGTLGLMRGIERFEYKRGYKLSTYTHWWIRQACTRAIADSSRTIKLPVHMHEAISRIRRLIRESGKTTKDFSAEYIARELSLPLGKVKNCLIAMEQRLFSWDGSMTTRFPDADAQGWTFGSLVHDTSPEANPQLPLEDRFREEEVSQLLSCLDPREQDIINHGFGLGQYDGAGLAFEILGHKYGCTRERVRQIQASALQKLSVRASKLGLRDFTSLLPV